MLLLQMLSLVFLFDVYINTFNAKNKNTYYYVEKYKYT